MSKDHAIWDWCANQKCPAMITVYRHGSKSPFFVLVRYVVEGTSNGTALCLEDSITCTAFCTYPSKNCIATLPSPALLACAAASAQSRMSTNVTFTPLLARDTPSALPRPLLPHACRLPTLNRFNSAVDLRHWRCLRHNVTHYCGIATFCSCIVLTQREAAAISCRRWIVQEVC